MFIQLLTIIHHSTTLLFGIFISAFFLGVKQNRKNILTLFLFFCCEGLLYGASFLLIQRVVFDQIYPLITHLPLFLFLVLYYKYPFLSSCVSIFSAYLCCQLSNWIGLLAFSLTGARWCYYVSRILTTIVVFFLLCKFVCRTTEMIFAKGERELCIIGFLPFVYYVFDYATTKFSSLLYSGSKTVAEFMGFAFCVAYLVFLLVYFKEYENKQEIKRYSDLMELQFLSVQKEIAQMDSSRKELAILRHDMRHHLHMILIQIQRGRTNKAMDYIREISDAYNNTVVQSYCKNEALNSVLSIYHVRFADKGFALRCDVSVGASLPCSDLAICAILSNALDNAIHAMERMGAGEKWANLAISTKGEHLLMRIENPIDRVPKFVDGIPTSNKKGHGIGVKSIVYYVEQINGQCSFSVSDHSFRLRIVL